MTVEEAQKWLKEHIEDGVTCPCCEQRVQIYRRKITKAMADTLVRIYFYFRNHDSDPWLHVPKFLETHKGNRNDTRGGDYAKLRFWGLIVPKSDIRDDGSPRCGYWRMTQEGHRFVEGFLSVPRFAHTYNNQVIYFSEELTNIYKACGDRYDFSEMMR